ncbi:MAG: Fic family protein [Candidatus Methanomethylophilaceae archaeon]
MSVPCYPIAEDLHAETVVEGLRETVRELNSLRSRIVPSGVDPELLESVTMDMESMFSCRIENVFEDDLIKGCRDGLMHDGQSDRISEIERICSSVKGEEMRIRGDGDSVCLMDRFGDVIATPPDGEYVKDLLENLIEYGTDRDVDPLIRIAVYHMMFEAIHPFKDGNGRTGRTLIVNQLMELGLIDGAYIAPSEFIWNNRLEYFSLLRRMEENPNWPEWISFILECIRWSCWKTNSILQGRSTPGGD